MAIKQRRLENAADELAAQQAQWSRTIADTRKNRPYREINAVQISVDHGATWKVAALCTACIQAIEPPTRAKPAGSAASLNCDRCDALNVTYKEQTK